MSDEDFALADKVLSEVRKQGWWADADVIWDMLPSGPVQTKTDVVEFLSIMGLLVYNEPKEPGINKTGTYSLTSSGIAAEKVGVRAYLKAVEDRGVAEHNANIAVVRGFTWARASVIINAVLTSISVGAAVLTFYWTFGNSVPKAIQDNKTGGGIQDDKNDGDASIERKLPVHPIPALLDTLGGKLPDSVR